MAEDTYESVPVRVERRDDQGVYVIGVDLDGVFVSFASVKTGHVDELVAREENRVAQEPLSDQGE